MAKLSKRRRAIIEKVEVRANCTLQRKLSAC